MIRRVAFAAAVSLVLCSPAVQAQDAAKTAPAAPPKEKKICRSEQKTGSMMTKRTCHTAAEWSAIDQNNATSARRFMDRMSSTAVNGES
ncbi:hypothetical protein [Novosphingobium soli]|uniref:Uncharacterized protein n=1 Tax=Novosphingobium soli TaxID=574956 RepID=A0ABV6CSU2_9SPHN